MILTFFVPGRPIPQGSSKAFVVTPRATGRPRAVVTHDNPQTRPWRDAIGYAAARAMREAGVKMTMGAVGLLVIFQLQRPKRLSARCAAKRHITRPDGDKLLRAVLDALSGIVFSDDSVVDKIYVKKQYAGGWGSFDQPGVRITVEMEAGHAP